MCRRIIIYTVLILGTTLISVNLGLDSTGIIASIMGVVFCYLFCYRYILKKNQTAALNYIQTMTNIPETDVSVSGFIRPTITLHNQQRVFGSGSFESIENGLHGVKFKKSTLIGYNKKRTIDSEGDYSEYDIFYVYDATEQGWKCGTEGRSFLSQHSSKDLSPEDLKKNQTAALNYIQTMTNIPEADVQVSGRTIPIITLLNQTVLAYRGEGSKRHLVTFETRIYGVKFERNTLIGYSQDTTAGHTVDYVYYATKQAWTFPAIIRDLEG